MDEPLTFAVHHDLQLECSTGPHSAVAASLIPHWVGNVRYGRNGDIAT